MSTTWFQSNVSALYASVRPTYPPQLFEEIVSFIANNGSNIVKTPNAKLPLTCLDIGCGTGQATRTLTHYFSTVIGVDPSPSQIEQAKQQQQQEAANAASPLLEYHCAGAENMPMIASASIDVATAAAVSCFILVLFFISYNFFYNNITPLYFC